MDLDDLIAELRSIRKNHGNVADVFVFTEYPLELMQLRVTGAVPDDDNGTFVTINVSTDIS